MYSLLLPLGALPLWLHHRIADMLWPCVYYLFRYRLKVTRDNLQRCFPDMDKKELRRIERRYYRHLTDLLLEGLHNTAASLKRIRRHYLFDNADLLTPYYQAGRSVVLMSAHYNNWEYMITSLDSALRHHAIGVGKSSPTNASAVGSPLAALASAPRLSTSPTCARRWLSTTKTTSQWPT